jgi:hypothetical protein
VRHLLDGMQAARMGWVDERQALAVFERSLHGDPLPSTFWPMLVTEWWLRLYEA